MLAPGFKPGLLLTEGCRGRLGPGQDSSVEPSARIIPVTPDQNDTSGEPVARVHPRGSPYSLHLHPRQVSVRFVPGRRGSPVVQVIYAMSRAALREPAIS